MNRKKGPGKSTRRTVATPGRAAPAAPGFRRDLQVRPTHMGYRPELNHDSVEALLTAGEGEQHR